MFVNFLKKLAFRVSGRATRRHLRTFEEATQFPQAWQEQILKRIIAQQSQTGFGRDHHFATIQNCADFRHNVPVAPYEYVEPYINRLRRGEFSALLSEPAVHMFALTSGTTATRKFIPVTAQYLADYKRGWNMWGLKVYSDYPKNKLRPILQMSGDWREFLTEAGTPCGAVSGLTASMQKLVVRWLYCVPACVGCIKDSTAKYYVALRLSIPRDVALIVTANPSTLVNLARAGDEQKERLIRDIHDGTLSKHVDIPAEIRSALTRVVSRPNPQRAKALEEIVRRTGHLYPDDYWAKDCVIGTWMGGSVGMYLRHFPRYFGNRPVRDIGLMASEGRMTIPMQDGSPSGILDITTHYFEFMPESEAGKPNPITLAAHEVQVGQSYYILPTTSYGLYRYHISDLVRVTGHHNRTPLVEFLSKGAHFANLTGEKLSEHHVTGAMKDVQTELNLTLCAFSVAPCWHEEMPYYGLFVEQGDVSGREVASRLAELLDRRLQDVNIEYAAKRQSRRLGGIRVQLLQDGAWHTWDQNRLKLNGGTLEQFKHPCLISDPKFRETITVQEELANLGEPAA